MLTGVRDVIKAGRWQPLWCQCWQWDGAGREGLGMARDHFTVA